MGEFRVAGNAATIGANATLLAIARAAAARSPYNVTVFSGARPGDSRMHGKGISTGGRAIDVVLSDPQTGAEVPNLKSSVGFPIYRDFAMTMRDVQTQIAPSINDSFRWGGGFSGKGYGAVDLMHFDYGSGAGMAGLVGDGVEDVWARGLTPTARQASIINGYGLGQLYSPANGRGWAPQSSLVFADPSVRDRLAKGVPTPPNELANLWGREPFPKTNVSLTPPTDTITGRKSISIAGPKGGAATQNIDPETDLMARTMLAEARGEGQDGMLAVGHVIQNRVNDASGRWGDSITDVLGEKNQFAPPMNVDRASPQYQLSYSMASAVRNGMSPDKTGGSVYFKTGAVSPAWAKSEKHNVNIGNHEFYGQAKAEPPTPRSRPVPDRAIAYAPEDSAITPASLVINGGNVPQNAENEAVSRNAAVSPPSPGPDPLADRGTIDERATDRGAAQMFAPVRDVLNTEGAPSLPGALGSGPGPSVLPPEMVRGGVPAPPPMGIGGGMKEAAQKLAAASDRSWTGAPSGTAAATDVWAAARPRGVPAPPLMTPPPLPGYPRMDQGRYDPLSSATPSSTALQAIATAGTNKPGPAVTANLTLARDIVPVSASTSTPAPTPPPPIAPAATPDYYTQQGPSYAPPMSGISLKPPTITGPAVSAPAPMVTPPATVEPAAPMPQVSAPPRSTAPSPAVTRPSTGGGIFQQAMQAIQRIFNPGGSGSTPFGVTQGSVFTPGIGWSAPGSYVGVGGPAYGPRPPNYASGNVSPDPANPHP